MDPDSLRGPHFEDSGLARGIWEINMLGPWRDSDHKVRKDQTTVIDIS